jgi:uncharacterized pyridoxal phosphate-containing UPF0001 family protein
VAQLIRGISPDRVRANLERVRAEVGPDVQILAATKYVAAEEMDALATGGVTLVGENRAQDLTAKHDDRFTWDFIGHLQSRKVAAVLPLVRYVHSVSTDSVLKRLEAHGTPETRVLIEVNVAGDPAKEGVAPSELGDFIARCPVTVVGLMTMPPFTENAEDNRRHFAALAELAADHGLRELSMGTTQDYAVAAQEGATIVRLGTGLYT